MPYLHCPHFSKLVNKSVGLVPAYAGIGDRLAVAVLGILLVAVLDVALDHKTLNEILDTLRCIAAVEHILTDTYLLNEFLAGVRVVAVNDD